MRAPYSTTASARPTMNWRQPSHSGSFVSTETPVLARWAAASGRQWPDVFKGFYGNRAAQTMLEAMIQRERIPQTLIFAGLEGLGKATLARRFAARLIGSPEKIERDDLSLEE